MQTNQHGKLVLTPSTEVIDYSKMSDKEIKWLADYNLKTDAPPGLEKYAGHLLTYLGAVKELYERQRTGISRGASTFAHSNYVWDADLGEMLINETRHQYKAGCVAGKDEAENTALRYAAMLAAPVKCKKKIKEKGNDFSISKITPHKTVVKHVPYNAVVNQAFIQTFQAATGTEYEDIIHVVGDMKRSVDLATLVSQTSNTLDPPSVCSKVKVQMGDQFIDIIDEVRRPMLSGTKTFERVVQYSGYLHQAIPSDTLGYFNSCHFDGFPARGKSRLNHDCLRDVQFVDADVYVTDRGDAHFLCGLLDLLTKRLNHKFVVLLRGKYTDGDVSKFLEISDDVCKGIIKTGQVTLAYARKIKWGTLRVHHMYFARPNFFFRKKRGWVPENIATDQAFCNDNALTGKSYQRYVVIPAVEEKALKYRRSAFVRHGLVVELSKALVNKDDANRDQNDPLKLMTGHEAACDVVNGLLHYATYSYCQAPWVSGSFVANFEPRPDVVAMTSTVGYKVSILSKADFKSFLKMEKKVCAVGGKSTLDTYVSKKTVRKEEEEEQEEGSDNDDQDDSSSDDDFTFELEDDDKPVKSVETLNGFIAKSISKQV